MASEAKNGYMGGSTLLAPFAKAIGMPLDQVNFILCQIVALLFGIPYRKYLTPAAVGPNIRHGVQIFGGIFSLLFCFGQQTWHVAAQAVVCVALMKTVKSSRMGPLVFAVSLGYLCVCHAYRVIYDYGGYTLDITLPLMIQTQRLSGLSFSLVDGQAKDREKLNDSQRKQAISIFPGALELLSYLWSFHMILCGPFCFFNDYIDFIEGRNIKESDRNKSKLTAISPRYAVIRKVSLAVPCLLVNNVGPRIFPLERLKEEEFLNSDFLSKTCYIILVTTVARFKYYFAWYLAAAVNNSAGLGYDSDQARNWDLVDNVDIKGVELSLSMKGLLDNWNVKTSQWLRHCVYERLPVMNTVCVFAVSAFWHGFYPGYYLCFGTAAAIIIAARTVRRAIRPWFQTSRSKQVVYDVITFVASRLALSYITLAFVLLEFWPSFRVYSALYFYIHVAVIAAIALLPTNRSRS